MSQKSNPVTLFYIKKLNSSKLSSERANSQLDMLWGFDFCGEPRLLDSAIVLTYINGILRADT